ncbi:YeiH family protein [Lichenicoccus sp.]|uniref:YeiH family protein n=1 Tax=Lichenicoccus sp. TaxID=2781899 RepID=UPI003D10110C
MLRFLAKCAPGVGLCIGVTLLAMALQFVEVRLVGQPFLEALVLAILLGVAIRIVWAPGPLWSPGIGFSAKILLEIAVMLLGASVSVGAVAALGLALLGGIVAVVAVAIGASYVISRLFRLPWRMSLLIACGNSICGNSAIAAVAPVIGADADDIASSIAFTAVLGVIVVLLLPLLVPLLHMSLSQYGVLAGLSVYAVPQVLAATLPIGALSNQVGTVVKLVRVLMLGPVVLAVSLLIGRRHAGTSGLRLGQLVPWFILGFLAVAGLRAVGLIPPMAIAPLKTVAALLTTISMAALGLGVDVRVVARAGAAVTTAVTLSLLLLCGMSLALIWALHVP